MIASRGCRRERSVVTRQAGGRRPSRCGTGSPARTDNLRALVELERIPGHEYDRPPHPTLLEA